MRSARTRKKQAEFYSESLSFIPLPQQGGQLGHAFGGAFAEWLLRHHCAGISSSGAVDPGHGGWQLH